MLQKCLEVTLIPLVRILLHVFFRQIEIAGTERIPADKPLIYTPNHLNSLVDGLLARVFLPGDPRPLAKATLWDITLIRPLLVAGAAIPVYRQQDYSDASHARGNEDMFSACYDALADKDSIVLFPEGQSHSESELQPLKTGAARIPRLLQTIYSLRRLSLFVIRLPLALLGLFLNAVPFYLTRLVSRIKVRPDRASTTKIAAGFILFPTCWTLQAMLLGAGLLPPVAWWLLAPLSGISSLLFRERHTQLLEELRTYLRLNTHVEMKEELEQRLANVDMELTEFLKIAAARERDRQSHTPC